MLIDGKAIANQIHAELKEKLAAFQEKKKAASIASHHRVERSQHIASDRISDETKKIVQKPCLAVIIVGEHPPSLIYVSKKMQACAETGIDSIRIALPDTIPEDALIAEIETLNRTAHVNGILIQLPLPPHINSSRVIRCVDPSKDVDGLHPINVGKMLIGEQDGFFPCTPLGIKVLLERTHIDVAGKHVLILGRSNLVGKPMAALLMQNAQGANATVTVAHSRSLHLKDICLSADVLIAAMGQPQFITADMVKEGAVVIDVGINKMIDTAKKSGYKIVGDVDFDHVKQKCAFITPVPGGIGPMTIAMLLSNTIKSFMNR